jgi:hypothetical protein
MIKKGTLIVFAFLLCWWADVLGPQLSLAQFCRDEVTCSKVINLGPVKDLVLCQYLRGSETIDRGQVDYAFCRPVGDPPVWECDRRNPKGFSHLTLTETEWSNPLLRCSKLCGECPYQWIQVDLQYYSPSPATAH